MTQNRSPVPYAFCNLIGIHQVNGKVTAQALGNGLTENFGYDNRGRITSYSLTNGWTSVYSFSLSYFPNGNVMTSTDSINGSWVYGYDDFNRLNSATVSGQVHSPNATFSYVYHLYGNRWQQNVTSGSGPMINLAFDANNHVTGSSITYDAAGNMTNDGSNSYTRDAEGRIASVPTLNTQYYYDAEGLRTIIYSSSAQYPYSHFIHDLDGHVLAYWSNVYGYLRAEYYINGRHLANFSFLQMFNHPDWLGTEHFRSTTNGSTEDTCQSDPFGDNMWCSQSDYTPVHFAGKEREWSNTASPTYLDDFGARFYSSSLALFVSPDPENAGGDAADPQSWNAYAYGRNNPLVNTDFDGRTCTRDAQGNFTGDTCGQDTGTGNTPGVTVVNAEDQDKQSRQTGARKQDLNDLLGLFTLGLYHPFRPSNAQEAKGMRSEALSNQLAYFGLGVLDLPGEAVSATEIVAEDGTKVTGFTKHGINRAVGDGFDRAGVRPQALLDALKNPEKIVSGIDEQGRPFKIFTGKDARVVVNPQTGQVVSANPLSGAGAH